MEKTININIENNFKEYEDKLLELQEAQTKVIEWSKKASSLADELANFEIVISPN